MVLKISGFFEGAFHRYYLMHYYHVLSIWDALRDLGSFVQYKTSKNTYGAGTSTIVAGKSLQLY